MSARPFTEAEYTSIVAHLAAAGRTRDKLLVVAGCATGFRIKELLTLTVGQVRDGAQVVKEVTVARRNLKGGKGAYLRSVKGRRVPLSEPVRSAIAERMTELGNVPPEAALFGTGRSDGKPMNRSQAFRILLGLAIDCGLDPTRISTHSLRKAFARRVYSASGQDLIKTQRIIGHSSPPTTARYLETDQSELDSLVRQLAA